jgi:Flp pilus assembly pilin Flp
MRAAMKKLQKTQHGQGMVEYALILCLVAVVIIIVLIATGSQETNLYSDITTTMRSAGI